MTPVAAVNLPLIPVTYPLIPVKPRALRPSGLGISPNDLGLPKDTAGLEQWSAWQPIQPGTEGLLCAAWPRSLWLRLVPGSTWWNSKSYVRDDENRVQYVNGFTLRKSKRPQQKEYYDAYVSDDFPHLIKDGRPVYRTNPLIKQPTDQMIKPSRKRFENIKATFAVNQDGVIYPVSPMPDAIRGFDKQTLYKLNFQHRLEQD
jgi:hypothetical protein